MLLIILCAFLFSYCNQIHQQEVVADSNTITDQTTSFPVSSWQYFLQHLPENKAPILDYTCKPV
ncbi:MAG: hypothetical protein JST21_05410 [Bacteroidetes bacterium]|nr:hypothetical protein [Bacteroidota bacterium]